MKEEITTAQSKLSKQQFTRSLQTEPCAKNLWRIYKVLQNFNGAIKSFQSAIERNAKEGWPLLLLGEALAANGDCNGAINTPVQISTFFSHTFEASAVPTLMARDPGLARDKPLRRSQIEDTIMVKSQAKKPAPKKVQKDNLSSKNKRKSNTTRRKPVKKARISNRELCERGMMHFILILM